MKVKITSIFLLVGLSFGARAQTVVIPDAHFVAYLQANFPSCMSGNQMDTTCTTITSATTVNCANDSIADLTGIQYFHNLTSLYCSHNLLTSLPPLPGSLINLGCDNNLLASLPTLPNSLQTLNCYTDSLTSLPTLPNSLIRLNCDYNKLASLPTLPNSLDTLSFNKNQIASISSLPNSLLYLNCSNNLFTNLPPLPNTLQYLYCDANHLTYLPALPSSLKDLGCGQNQISSFPTLPNSIQYFNCCYNPLITLPTLPTSLTGLYCYDDNLTSLPALPNSLLYLDCAENHLSVLPTLPNSLNGLYCYTNLLTSLPSLPSSLQTLECTSNLLTYLPTLPNGLSTLLCAGNNISCFPIFPNSLTNNNPANFNIYSNPFHCLPNYVPAMDPTILAYPLCVTGDVLNNPNGCAGSFGIEGYTYKDNDANCIYDVADSTKRNVMEQLYDSTSTLISQTFSAMNGVYDFPEPVGTYTVKIDTAGVPYTVQCAHPGIDSTTTLTAAVPLETNVNFSITCKPGFDVGVQSVMNNGVVFPGQPETLQIVAGDLSRWYGLNCASGVAGQVVVTVTGPVTYSGIAAGALTPSITGNVYTYTIADFGTVNNSTAFGLVFTVNNNAVAGSQVCVTVSVTPTAGDNNVSNNTYSECFDVVNSYDPNYKETYPETVNVGYDDYFIYTVHFQNTGNAAAININVKDTLDADLDLRTFQIINYSNYCTALLNGNQLSVNFPNIQLPDSTSNFNGSQGFVQYRIKPLAGLPGGTMIHNKASIYFDYNAPVVTNTTVNQFMLTTGIKENKISTLSVYPNPSKGKYFVKLSDGTDVSKLSIEVINVLGEIIVNTKTQNILSQIDLSNQPAGIYFVRVIGGTQALNERVVKE